MINYFATLFILKQKGYMDQDEWTAYENYIRSVLCEQEFQKL
ncbi:MAG: hypothetical protein ABSF71_04815 [Terriglobia bacterium]|jgi:hypothetical protein